MAGFKQGFSKGLATLNVKTSNFMEENKLKTGIATKEAEIAALKAEIGELVYQNRNSFTLDIVADRLRAVEERYAAIEALNNEISMLAQREAEILGAQAPKTQEAPTEANFCPQCGAPNAIGYKFCEKCGNKLD